MERANPPYDAFGHDVGERIIRRAPDQRNQPAFRSCGQDAVSCPWPRAHVEQRKRWERGYLATIAQAAPSLLRQAIHCLLQPNLRRRRRRALAAGSDRTGNGAGSWPLAVQFVGVTLTAVYAYGNIRFRAPVEPVLCVLAAVAVAPWVARLSSRLQRAGR